MKTYLRSSFLIILLFSFVYTLQAQTFTLKQSNETGVYKSKEKIKITANTDQKTNDTLWVKVIVNNVKTVLEKTFVPAGEPVVIYESSFRKPCSVIVEAKMKGNRKTIGLIVDPLKIKPGIKAPKDLLAYWNKEKENLKALPWEVKFGKNECKLYEYVCFDTEINSTGPKPARGYFAKPTKAPAKSLPIVLLVHAAGVKGAWCKSDYNEALRYAKMGKGTICLDLNAHGMLDGQPDEYYNNLETGELKDYFYQGLEDRENVYFKGMYLRLLRSLDFLTTLPEWDGKRILVIGESQGGGQALAAAGLDQRVSAVVATVPAMCDWGGTFADRKGGWPQPYEQPTDKSKMKKALPYFDNANLLKFSKAKIVVEIGLADNTCPSTSVYAAINQAKGEKIIFPVPYREHSWPTAEQRPVWDKAVAGPKNAFIEDYLK